MLLEDSISISSPVLLHTSNVLKVDLAQNNAYGSCVEEWRTIAFLSKSVKYFVASTKIYEQFPSICESCSISAFFVNGLHMELNGKKGAKFLKALLNTL